jgi:hypothetical protein
MLQYIGDNGLPAEAFPLGKCQGDCDNDSECEQGLSCFQRDGTEDVPGCVGIDNSRTDYCYDPKDDQAVTPGPTPRPIARDTLEPTDLPTMKPTPRPSNRPTIQPTDRPTRHPTANPTDRPTSKPSPSPTASRPEVTFQRGALVKDIARFEFKVSKGITVR